MTERASLAFASPRRIIASMRVRRDATSANSAATKNAFAITSRATTPNLIGMESTAGTAPETMGQATPPPHGPHPRAAVAVEADPCCVPRPVRPASTRALGWVLALTLTFAAVEVAGGLLSGALV